MPPSGGDNIVSAGWGHTSFRRSARRSELVARADPHLRRADDVPDPSAARHHARLHPAHRGLHEALHATFTTLATRPGGEDRPERVS